MSDDVLVVDDDATAEEIYEAIDHCLGTADIDPRIREAFINALTDQRNRLEQR